MQAKNFPPEFEQRMRGQLGEAWNAFAEVHAGVSPISIRLNGQKAEHQTIELLSKPETYQRIPWTESGYYLNERPSFTLDPSFHAGAYYVQEASSMLLEQAIKQCVGDQEVIRALDLCASPGGKSTHLLSLLSKDSLVVSNEVIRSRATILAENIMKWGYSNVVVTNNDPEDFQRLTGFFDLMVVDAPCSGEGLFRKDPDAMKEWSLDNTNLCSLRQQRILHDIWPALKEDGLIVYSTCTYNPEENANNLRKFLEEHDAEIFPLKFDKAWGIEELSIGYQCFPHQVQGEGFYIAVLRKKEALPGARLRVTKNVFHKPVKLLADYQQWVVPADQTFLQFKDYLLALPASLTIEMEFLASLLKIVSAGTTVGTVKHTKLIPDHALALSIYLNKESFPSIEVEKEEAIAYLRKDVFWKEGLTKGFSRIDYKGFTIGWVNVLDNRLNNLYPAEWRIRMAANS